MSNPGPDIEEVRALRECLGEDIWRTPVVRCPSIENAIGGDTEVVAKLEFLQRTGTFKARAALANLSGLSEARRAAGVTAVSAGNHAIAVAFAASVHRTTAKVVMIRTANPLRIDACREYGAEVVIAADAHEAFEMVERIQIDEGRHFVHPFDGVGVALGTGTCGLEICDQVGDFDAIIVPVGGGGLIGGIGNVVNRLRPGVEVIGVEPDGADTTRRSLASGKPESIDEVRTIADSLGAPFALPYSFALAQAYVDRMAIVDDDALRRIMGFLFREMKLALEPACCASTAALLGPLREDLRGSRVVLVMCGSNIDWDTFERQAVFDD